MSEFHDVDKDLNLYTGRKSIPARLIEEIQSAVEFKRMNELLNHDDKSSNTFLNAWLVPCSI